MTGRRLFGWSLLGWVLIYPFVLTAEPQVLHDTGRTIPIEPFLAPIQPKTSSPPAAPPPPYALPAGSYGLPVETPSMSPGKVTQRALPALQGKMAGANPLFLIGADQWSLRWLEHHRQRLADLHAVGMVVAVETGSDLAILRKAAGDLQLMPASGEAIARHLGLRHYPVLIAPPGVAYQ